MLFLLLFVVRQEEPEVEKKRQNLIIESAQSKAQLKEIEDPRAGRIDRVAGLGASSLSDPSRRDGHFERIRHGTVFL